MFTKGKQTNSQVGRNIASHNHTQKHTHGPVAYLPKGLVLSIRVCARIAKIGTFLQFNPSTRTGTGLHRVAPRQ